MLGEGESIENGVYRCVINPGGLAGNSHRALVESRCGFNSDRWTFSTGQQVTYGHRLRPGAFASARLNVNLNYYVGGELIIEAGPDGSTWEPMGGYEMPPTEAATSPSQSRRSPPASYSSGSPGKVLPVICR